MAKKGAERFDVSPLIRTIQYLDEVLKRGVVVGVVDEKVVITDDADVQKALTHVSTRMAELHRDMTLFLRDCERAQRVGAY